MIKSNELSSDNSSNKIQTNQKANEIQNKNINRTNKNIINIIHLIKESINNSNNNKLHFIKRNNNYRKAKDINLNKNKSISKSKNKEIIK